MHLVRKTTGIVAGERPGAQASGAVWTTGETERCTSWVLDAERSDALDGVRRQLSRAGPDLGLRDAQLSGVRARAVLDRLRFRRLGGRFDRDVAGRVDGLDAAAAVGRRRADIGDLPRRDGHPPILSPAAELAVHLAGDRARLRRPFVLYFRL